MVKPDYLHHDDDQGVMSFGDHLDELRRRLLWALAVPLPLALIAFFLSDTLIAWLLLPLTRAQRASDLQAAVQVLSPPEFLAVQLKLSIIAGIVISAPWIIWQLWLFIRPGLYQHERRFVRFLLPGSALLTVLGVALMYYIMLPLMLMVLVGIGKSFNLDQPEPTDDPRIDEILSAAGGIPVRERAPATPQPGDAWLLWPQLTLHVALPADENAPAAEPAQEPGAPAPAAARRRGGEDDPPAASIGDSSEALPPVKIVQVQPRSTAVVEQQFRFSFYINFVLVLLLGITIAFQMPLVLVLLGWMGLVTPAWLAAQRRYALLVCAVIAAVITPADAVSMILMLIPLYGLYELGILLMRLAPASRVAEGRIFHIGPWRMRAQGGSRTEASREPADKPAGTSEQPLKPSQADATVPRKRPGSSRGDDSPASETDDEGTES